MNFAPKELVERARKMGFEGEILVEESSLTRSSVEWGNYESGNTVEQLETWLWDKHQEFYFSVHSVYEVDFGWTWNYFDGIKDKHTGRCYNPFTARLDGVTKAITYLEEQK